MTERKLFTYEWVDIETFIAITLNKEIRSAIGVGAIFVTVDRSELLTSFLKYGVKQVMVDEYPKTVYLQYYK